MKAMTIFDYLEWRADIPFSVDSFNEVDNLVLSELAYADFGGIVPPDGRKISLFETYQAFYAAHTREEIAARTSSTARAPFLMDEMVCGARFEGMMLSNFIDLSGEGYQLSAVVFHLPDGTKYVAFRGTDGTVTGWKEDFNFSFMNETEGQRLAVEYLNGVDGLFLRVGGHSKGGNLAIYASAFCDCQDRILEVYSNDGPGFRNEIVCREEFRRILPKVKRILPNSSIIGQLLTVSDDCRVVKSSAAGIKQHDAFTWQVKRNRFQDAALTETSKMINQTISSWLENMNDEDRKSFTELLFSIIESTGRERFSVMKANKIETTESIVNAVRLLPKEKQQEGLKLLGQLSQSGGQTLLGYLAGLIK